jgi:hypothetical protein
MRVERISELVTTLTVTSSLVYTRATWRHVPEDNLHGHLRKNLNLAGLLLCLKIDKIDREKTGVLKITGLCHLNQGKADLACATHPVHTWHHVVVGWQYVAWPAVHYFGSQTN